MLLIGIDEAGYGPRLGPLCHGYCAFRCPETPDRRAPDLWALLHPAVTKHPAPAPAPPAPVASLTVDDSKKVYSTAAGLGLLVQGVSGFLECIAPHPSHASHTSHASHASHTPPTGDSLYQRLIPEADRARLEEDAWAREQSAAPEPQRAGSASLHTALKRSGVSVLALGARALSAKHFNAALGSCANKADVNWSIIAEELVRLLALGEDGEDILATVDRQGGRKFYGAQLAALLAGALPWVESEKPEASVYRFEARGRIVRIAFLVNAESSSLPVALASMAAKLARELCMRRFNLFSEPGCGFGTHRGLCAGCAAIPAGNPGGAAETGHRGPRPSAGKINGWVAHPGAFARGGWPQATRSPALNVP